MAVFMPLSVRTSSATAASGRVAMRTAASTLGEIVSEGSVNPKSDSRSV